MKLKTEIKEIPAQTVASATGLIFSIPCEAFVDPERPGDAIASLLKVGHVICEYGAPVIDPCQNLKDVEYATHRVRSADIENACGYISNIYCVIDEGQLQLAGDFTPYGPHKAAAVELMRSGTILITPRVLLNEHGKIACIPGFDVAVEETPHYQFVRMVKQ